MAHRLFDFVQVRDMGDPDVNLTRSNHVPMITNDVERLAVAALHKGTPGLTRDAAMTHVVSSSFQDRAEVVKILFQNDNGLNEPLPQSEFADAGELMAAAYAVARLLRKDVPFEARHLGRLAALANQAIGTAQAQKLDPVWVVDLACLYRAPFDGIEYRRLLAGLRRLTYVLVKVGDRGFAQGVAGWQAQPDAPNIVRDLILKSRIVIAPDTFAPKGAAPAPEPDKPRPVRPDFGAIRGVILNQSTRRRTLGGAVVPPKSTKKGDR